MFKLGYGNQGACELLQAQAHVWNHIFNFINSMSLKCAVELGIPDVIWNHGKPISMSQLIAALPIQPAKAHCIPRLMRILVHSGFFAKAKMAEKHEPEEEEEEGFVLTNASKLLLKDNPLSVTPLLLAMLDPLLTKPWDHFSAWFQNDDPTPFDTAHGKSLWDCAGDVPRLNNFFNKGMASDARLVANVLMNERNSLIFEGLKSLVDVGGGTGTLAKSIAKAFPQLDCTVLDLPHVVSGLQDSENVKFVGGDMFKAIPPADAVLLKWILHDWSNEECVKILKQCKEAIKGREGGKLIIIDMVMGKEKEDKDDIETQLFFDMLMMALLTGKERNENEWAKLFYEAGFGSYKINPIMGLRSIIQVYP